MRVSSFQQKFQERLGATILYAKEQWSKMGQIFFKIISKFINFASI